MRHIRCQMTLFRSEYHYSAARALNARPGTIEGQQSRRHGRELRIIELSCRAQVG
jgi:hypothetical protein